MAGDQFRLELLFDPGTRKGADLAPHVSVPRKTKNMARQFIRFGFGYDPGHAVLDHVADAVHSRGDTGHSRRHGLQHNIGHALMVGRQQENVGGAYELSGIRHTAEKADPVVEPEARHLALQLVEAAEILPGDRGLHRAVATYPCDRIDEAVEALLGY